MRVILRSMKKSHAIQFYPDQDMNHSLIQSLHAVQLVEWLKW
jgi:hypothetical protein